MVSLLTEGLPHFGLVEWNDEPGRTQAEVLARFDAAIERLSRSVA
jgi:hypothetical protein